MTSPSHTQPYPSVPAGIYSAGQFESDPTFNVTASSMAPVRRSLSLVGTSLVPHLNVGDSLSSGFSVSGIETPTQSWPGYMRQYMGAPFGYADGGSLVASADALHWPQWTYTANWASTAATFFQSTGAGTATYTSTDTGTVAFLIYYDNATSFTWNVDGAGGGAIVGGNTGLPKIAVQTGLALGTHVVNAVAAGAGVIVLFAGVLKTTGMLFNNWAQTSSGVLSGYGGIAGASGSWTSTTAGTVGQLRTNAHNLLTGTIGGITFGPPMVSLCIGSNDICAGGASPAAVIAGYEILLAKLTTIPGTAVYIVTQFRQPTATDAQWTAWLAALFSFALKHNLPVFDWNARLGGYSAILAEGNMLQTDNIHPLPSANINIGYGVAQGLAA